MKHLLPTTAVMAVILLMLLAFPVQLSDSQSNEIQGESIGPDGGVYTYVTSTSPAYHSDLVGYKEGSDTFERIQSRLEGYEITVIRDGAFADCTNTTAFVIPRGITNVGSSVFSGCTSLTDIFFLGQKPALATGWNTGLSSNVKIHCLDTHYDSWKDIVKTEDKVVVKNYTSDKCSFRYIELNGSVTVLEHVSGTDIVIPSTINGKNVTHINDSAFQYTEGSGSDKISNVTIGNNVQYIGVAAFKYCEFMESVNFPSSLKVIMDEAFRMPIDNVNWSRSMLQKIELNNGLKYIGFEAFRMCYKVKEVVVPDSVTHYGDGAFRVCSSMERIKIGKEVKELGEYSLDNCFALSEVVLPSGLTKIGDNCFHLDRSLRTITLPDAVTTIGTNAFYGCTSLSDVSMPGTVSMKTNSFTNCPLQNLTITGSGIGDDLKSFINNGWRLPGASSQMSLITIDSESAIDVGFNGRENGFVRFTDRSVNTTGGVFKDGSTELTGAQRAGKTFVHSSMWNKCEASTLRVYSSSTALGDVVGGGTFVDGTIASVKAVPNKYCEFVAWSDGVRTTERSITITADVTIVAEFKNSVTYNLTFVSIPEGKGGCPSVGKYVAGTEVTVTAKPIDGYNFIAWSDGVKTPERKVVMDSDKELMAYFGNLSVTFDLNGVEGNVETIYTNSGWTVTLPSPEMTHDGKRIVAWEIDGQRYDVGASFVATSSVVAKAVWESSGQSMDVIVMTIVILSIIAIAGALFYIRFRGNKSKR